ncbi:unnamed protein product [Malus baccata var. baccata]
MFAVEPHGLSGGLCVLWKDGSQVTLLKSEEFVIEMKIWDDILNKQWRLFAIYASTDEKKRKDQWKRLGKRIEQEPECCLLIGDFNDILCNEEKEGGNYRPASSMRDFREFVASNELMDLGYEGYPFTWRNNRESLPIQQRLDRGLATMGWNNLYPDTTIRHLVLEGSDHAMLVLSTEKLLVRRGRMFSYDARWSKLDECRELVAQEWDDHLGGSHAFRICEKLKLLRKRLKVWYHGRGRNSKKAIDKLKDEIRKAYTSNKFASEEVKLKERDLRSALRNEEAYWKAKSRVQWLREGDKNTKFFHAQTLKRRRYNQIKGLEDSNGIWHTGDKDICDIANSYFMGLFQSCSPNQIRDVEVCMETRVSPEDNRDLVAPITDEEINVAVFQIPSDRAPGPDGFSGCFYKDHWTTVGKDVVKAIKAFWHSGKLLRKLNHTNLVLIPKVKCPKNMTQFRPIALCNVIYKILAKVITNRLKRIMPKVIGDNQSAFVAGKQIQDNILVVHEILHSLNHQSKDMQKGMAIKLDMAKAYDRVEWDFLLSMMSKLGFAPFFCNRVKECISTVSFSILINGSPTGYIQPQRGLRQGDPLSPFLFLICTEGFSSLIKNGMERGALHGYRFIPNGTPLTHLFFADDSVLFGNATVEEAKGVADILNTYARGSGQEINLSKSSIFFGTSTSKRIKKRIGNTLGIMHKDGFGKYLGLQADFGLSKKAVFAEIRDKMEARLAGWSEQFLSQAGKEVLIKAVAMALPNFAMSCFKLPIGICRDMEKAVRSYWWRGYSQKRGCHWASWDRLMKQKSAGGLGFKDFQCFNLAFLAKIGWRLIQNPTSLLANVLRDKYYPGKCFKDAGRGRNTSWGWKGIFESRTVLQHGVRWRVGDGESINIRKDPWLPTPSTFLAKPLDNLEEIKVRDLIDPISKSWKEGVVTEGFNRDEARTILSIPLSKSGCLDRLVWHYTVNGDYSVKTGYGVAMNLMENGALGKKGRGASSVLRMNNLSWKRIWKLQVPNKIKFFLWKCCNKVLAVRHNLQRRHIRVENICGVCNTVDESENHLFFQCEFSHRFWFGSSLHINSYELAGGDFLESWDKICTSTKNMDKAEEILQEVAFGLWRIWKNRNDVVFNGVYRQHLEVMMLWRKNIYEYREAMSLSLKSEDQLISKNLKTKQSPQLYWTKPKFGTIKVNTDAAWCSSSLRTGVGWVGRDFAGLLQAAGGTGSGFCHSAAAAEALAIRYALLACIEHGFHDIIIESDASSVIKMLKKEVLVDFSIECILGDIEVLVHKLRNVSFAFVPREGNHAAHSVAKYVFKEGRSFSWDCIGPDFLFNFLAKDVNLSIRL